jgi:hypothetical protein
LSIRFRPAPAPPRRGGLGLLVASVSLAAALLPVPATAGPRTVVVAVDEAPAAGIAESTQTWSATVNDFNGDGWPDFFLSRHGEATGQLFENDRQGHFAEAGAGTFRLRDRHGCTSADVDGNSRPDVFCSIGASRGTAVKSNELWVQQADGNFLDRAFPFDVQDSFGRGRESIFFDATGDGWPDLFVGNYDFRTDGLPTPNRLFVNQGGQSFADAPQEGLDRPVGAHCAQGGDVNGDGREDLLVCGTRLFLYRNDGPSGFTDVAAQMGVGTDRPGQAVMADLNGDGLLDLAEVSATRLTVRLQQGGAFQTAFTYALVTGAAVGAGDVNGDGRADLYVVQGARGGQNDPDVMLQNDGTGTAFSELPIPETTVGKGDRVYPIDFDRNGLMDFLVLNGADTDGPLQLISFFAAADAPEGSTGRLPRVAGEEPGNGAPAAGGAGGKTACSPSWSPAAAPDAGAAGPGLSAVVGATPADLWAVGSEQIQGQLIPVAAHWDGATWTLSSVAGQPHGDSGFEDAAAVGPGDLWAVGFRDTLTGSAEEPVNVSALVDHWNGSAWTTMATPDVPGSAEGLVATAGFASDMWAVGFSIADDGTHPLIEHWDGTAWSVVQGGSAAPGGLLDVMAFASTDVWAVGYSNGPSGDQTLIEHWDGTGWTVAPSANPGLTENVLAGVNGASPGDLWAVGFSSDGTSDRSLVEHWDGSAWSVVPSLGPAAVPFALISVSAASAGDVWGVGVQQSPNGRYLTFAEHWDGATWTPASTAASTGSKALHGVRSFEGTEAWAVGWSSGNVPGLVERVCPIRILDGSVVPSSSKVALGATAGWSIPATDGVGHAVVDASGLGLFDSGVRPPGSSFTHTFGEAGTYPVADPQGAGSSTVAVAPGAMPSKGSPTTSFTIVWAGSAPPADLVFDVQIQRPGATDWVAWPADPTAPQGLFVPDGGSGRYSFRARLRDPATGAATRWSPPVGIAVH